MDSLESAQRPTFIVHTEVRAHLKSSVGAPLSLFTLKYAPTEDLRWVPLQKLVNFAGQAFIREQHHFVRYLEDGIESLAQYYRVHQPKNAGDFSFINPAHQDFRLQDVRALPWREPQTAAQPSRNWPEAFGPVSDYELAVEAAGLDYLLERISKNACQGNLSQSPGKNIIG